MHKLFAFALLLAACGDDGGSPSPDASVATFTSCTGACKVTALTATFGGTSRTLDQGFYGVTTEAGATSLYVEIDRGLTVCPEMDAPTPEYSLILGTVPVPVDPTPASSPGNLLDYTGDLLPGTAIGQKATTVTLTPTAANDVLAPGGFIAFDADLVFPDGTLTGHFYAQHCASLDETL